MCTQTTVCVLILLCVLAPGSSGASLANLYVCTETTICVLTLLYVSWSGSVGASLANLMHLILLCMCPHTTICVSSPPDPQALRLLTYMCVLKLLCVPILLYVSAPGSAGASLANLSSICVYSNCYMCPHTTICVLVRIRRRFACQPHERGGYLCRAQKHACHWQRAGASV